MSTVESTRIRELAAVFADLDRRDGITEQQLNRLYRHLARSTHPDAPAGDEEAFRFLVDAYERARASVRQRARYRALFSNLDPHRIPREMGYPHSEDPWRNLWISLERFFSLGLHRRRVFARESLRKRNEAVVRTILYWGSLTGTAFVTVFSEFVRDQGDFSITDHTAKEYFLIRKTLLRGITWFLRYQATGRVASRDIAGDYIRYALKLSARFTGIGFRRLEHLAQWFVSQLDSPPSVHEIA